MAGLLIQTSLHGRRAGISSSGALLDKDGYKALVSDSTGQVQNSTSTYFATLTIATATINAFVEGAVTAVNSSVGSTITNSGISVLSSATTTLVSFQILAPVAGSVKRIISATSASVVNFLATSTTIVFASSGSAGAPSSGISISIADSRGEMITLVATSATRWVIAGKSGGWVLGESA